MESRMRLGKGASLARVVIVYVVALGAGAAWLFWGPGSGHLLLDGLIADLIATVVIFAASRTYGNSSFYDAYWSVLPPLLAAYWFWAGPGAEDVRWWLMAAVILVWSIRLTANWVRGFPGLHHEDWRYAKIRESAGRLEMPADLFAVHVIPTLQVFAGLLPVYLVATRAAEPFGWLDVVALLVGLGAITIETAADLQLHRFVATAAPGEVMDRGLWSWSRHPNYFGEFGFWLALALFGLAADPGAWWVFAGPAVMLAMFYGASIPWIEQRSLERRPAYADVVRRVPRFVPLPPRTSGTQ